MYDKFDTIDGTHPWRDVSPEGFVDYPARYRQGGRVLFFNFSLARDMGLIPQRHPARMNPALEEAVLKTFSIQILNEHDWINRKRFPRDGYEDRLYMATRYLQMQHENKRGKTSGDGRSIWNGCVRQGAKVYDVSSRGTGNTILSPGVQEAGQPLPTGKNDYGYSSGLADLDEMIGSALMSEIFYQKGVPTERMLAVIAFPDNTSIGVRTAPNLLRPAHFFRYLKMGMWKELKDSYDYFLARQVQNGEMNLPDHPQTRYYASLAFLVDRYSRLAALMEGEYIFNWLTWDGDNILASGALLDYGSIRQFAAKHSKYRYEDVDRFSTSLTEQKREARYIIQTFAQMIDFIVTGEKKSVREFEKDKHLELFDACYEKESQRVMLYNAGFTPRQITKLVKNNQREIRSFCQSFNYFEDVKALAGRQKVPDGVDHPPVFLIRNTLRELPRFLLNHEAEGEWPVMPAEDFCRIMARSYVEEENLKLTKRREEHAFSFQRFYQDLILAVSRKRWLTLKALAKRAAVLNYQYRNTGDGLTWVVFEAIAVKDKIDQDAFQQVLDRYIKSQILVPGKFRPFKESEMKGNSYKARLLRKMREVLDVFKETI
jgi:hypothetical protein